MTCPGAVGREQNGKGLGNRTELSVCAVELFGRLGGPVGKAFCTHKVSINDKHP